MSIQNVFQFENKYTLGIDLPVGLAYIEYMTTSQRKLKAWMKRSGWSQQTLAKELGITQGAVGHWLSDTPSAYRQPSVAVLRRLSKLTGIAAYELRPDLRFVDTKANGQ